MTITTLPTKTDASIGRVKTDGPGEPSPDLRYDVPAAEYERIKDAIIALASAVGLDDGSTPGSLRAALVSDALKNASFAGSWVGALVRTAAGTYEARRIATENGLLGLGHATPTAADDSSLGFGVGSIWVQMTSDGSALPVSLWMCTSPTVGAAVWVRLQAISDLLSAGLPSPLGRSLSGGLSAYAARLDHTHDSGRQLIQTVSASTNLTDVDIAEVDTSAGAVTLTLPYSTVGTAGYARRYRVAKTSLSANGITVARTGADTIRGLGASLLLPGSDELARGMWELKLVGTNWVIVDRWLDYPEPSELASSFIGAWFADQGVTSTAGRVSAWAEAYGSGRSFAQATATVQPYLRTGGAPGMRASLFFDATRDTNKGDYLELANESAWSSITTWTVLLLACSTGQGNSRLIVNKTASSASGAFDLQLAQNYTLGQCPSLAGATSYVVTGAPGGSATPSGAPINTWDALGFTSDGAAGGAKVVSGARKLTEATFTPTANSAPIRIGRRIDGTANAGFHGEVAAVLIWSRALSEAEVQSQVRWLLQRYR